MSLLSFLKLLISLLSLYGSIPVSMLNSMVMLFVFSYQQTKDVLVGKFLHQAASDIRVVQNVTANRVAIV